MPETLFIKDFSAGWCPSDDPVNGRPNAQLNMQNLEIAKNGSITLVGGTAVVHTGYSAYAHTLYSRYINGTRYDYAACADSTCWRNTTKIISSGGNGFNAAFSTAFNYTLVCDGAGRFKDDGTTLTNLGLTPPTVPNNPGLLPMTSPVVYYNASTVVPTGYGSFAYVGSVLELTTNTSGLGVVQSYPGALIDMTQFTGTGISGTASGTPDDYMEFSLGAFLVGYDGFQIDFLLINPDSAGDQVSDYFSYNTGSGVGALTQDIGGNLLIRIRKQDFVRVGSSPNLGWNTVYGFRISYSTLITPGAATLYIKVESPTRVLFGLGFVGGSFASNGIYDYALMGVNQTTSYLAKSTLSPILPSIDNNNKFLVPQISWTAPTDPQITNVWIFRRNAVTGGGNGLLGQWYQVGVVPVATTTFYDTTSDQAALTTDITVNLNLISIAYSSISDAIYDIVGPVGGRWYYFTSDFMYPSDLNDPDLVDASLAVRTCGSASELFLWARAISASVVLVGTSLNIYLLTGTFTTLPDNSIDVYYQPEGITQFPPVTFDAISYQGAVYYLAHDGWRICTATSFGTTYSSAQNGLIVAPNLDSIYRGVYNGQAPGSVRFPCMIANNKLYCYFPLTQDLHVYDFTRQYWTFINYNLGPITALAVTQDGQLLAFYSNSLQLLVIADVNSKLINGTINNSIVLLLTYKDNGQPRQRKDPYTFKSLCTLLTPALTITLNDENGHQTTLGSLVTTITTNTEQFLDLSQLYEEQIPTPAIPKLFQLEMYGTVADCTFQNFSIDYDLRPIPTTFIRLYPNNFKTPSLKRIRTWPLVLDTRGNSVTFTPIIDGAAYPAYSSTFNTNDKQTVFHYFTFDLPGVDFGGLLYDPSGLMEFWEMGNPEIVQVFPVPKLFDQIGPQEFSRLGKVVQLGLRVYAYPGLLTIPYNLMFQDSSVWTGNFAVASNVEDTYYSDVPKGVNGRIIRVVLGPTTVPFSRYYMKFRCAQSGGQENTELSWITIPGQMPNL